MLRFAPGVCDVISNSKELSLRNRKHNSVESMMNEPVTSVNDLDAWIEKLYSCKPLTENEVKLLCEKVSLSAIFYL